MKLLKYLSHLGYGTRREVALLCEDRRVRLANGMVLSADDAFEHADVRVDGEPLDVAPGSVVMLHKPAGYVCSTVDPSPVIYSLLPGRFARRSPILAPVGRLDRDTSGLLLLTDDGQLLHRLTSPRSHFPKRYEATLAHDLRGDEAAVFASGTMMLDGERHPLQRANLDALAARRVRLTLSEGRYHQVRRMFAAVGNHVETLHRDMIGHLSLGDLRPGAWRVLTAAEVDDLRGTGRA